MPVLRSASRCRFLRVRAIALQLGLSLACVATMSVAPRAQDALHSVPGEIIVGLYPTLPLATNPLNLAVVAPSSTDVAFALADLGDVQDYRSDRQTLRLRLRPGLTQAEAIAALRNRPGIAYAEPNYLVTAADSTPNDPSFLLQYGLVNINAAAAWNIWKPRQQVVIAVVDSGVENTHADLKNKIWRDANGIIGYSAFKELRDAAADDNGHGTHVAGIAAAQTNNGIGIAGVAGWNGLSGDTDTQYIKIMPVKVLDNKGNGTDYTVAGGIYWAVDRGAKVLNLSLSSTQDSKTLRDAVEYAWKAGCVVVCAAGNEGRQQPDYPAGNKYALSVAATDSRDNLASFSNRGNWVTVAAPGAAIYSTWLGSSYGMLEGTSMATPFVSGEATLLLSQNPGLTNAQVVSLIGNNVDIPQVFGKPAPLNVGSGGRINIGAALKAATPNASLTAPMRLNAGGSYTTGSGITFTGDTSYAKGGSLWKWSVNPGTPDAALYQTARCSGSSFSYALPAPAGNYTLKLYFAEGLGSFVTTPGLRTFNIIANGTTLTNGTPLAVNFDIVKEAGGQGIGISRSFPVTSDGSGVTVTFQPTKFLATVTALELIPVDAAQGPSAPGRPMDVVATSGTSSNSLTWTAMPNVVSYNVKRSVSNKGPLTQISSPGSVTSARFTDTTATPGVSYYYVVSAVNAAGESADSDAATNKSTASWPGLRINVGGAYTASDGTVFTADAFAQGGNLWSWNVFPGTLNAPLYQTARYSGASFSYVLPAPAGNYTLKLYFAEGLGSSVILPGQRTFSISANGTTLESNFDVVKEAGGQGIGISRSYPIKVTDVNGVTVTFQAKRFNAMVSAIEIVPAK